MMATGSSSVRQTFVSAMRPTVIPAKARAGPHVSAAEEKVLLARSLLLPIVIAGACSLAALYALLQRASGTRGAAALNVGVGLSVVHRLMEAEVDEVVGRKGNWNPDRTAKPARA